MGALFGGGGGAGAIRPFLHAAAVVIASLISTGAHSDDIKITGLTDLAGKASVPEIGLYGYLVVKLSGTAPIDPEKYVLFLDGREIAKLDDTVYRTDGHALVFHLRRSSDNASAWAALLGSPSWESRRVSVALGEKKSPPASAQPTITSDGGVEPQFLLAVLPRWWLTFAVAAVLGVVVMVWGGAKKTTIIRDNLLPQLPPDKQPYSLARWQMAFWFTLIFASFVFLFVLLWDYNTVTEQALTLMGISGATALAAVAVDAAKDSPAVTANNALRALGLKSYADVVTLQQEIADRRRALASVPPPAAAAATQLQTEIDARQAVLTTYEDTVKPIVSEGWYRDLTMDSSGPALHRLQVFCWTWILGGVFVIGVYRNFAMPQFSGTLLALMAVTGAGYVGFKYPEKQ